MYGLALAALVAFPLVGAAFLLGDVSERAFVVASTLAFAAFAAGVVERTGRPRGPSHGL
jgi:hypothetical protein